MTALNMSLVYSEDMNVMKKDTKKENEGFVLTECSAAVEDGFLEVLFCELIKEY